MSPSPSTPTLPGGLAWWGRHELQPGSVGLWRIGPMTLRIRRELREWRIALERSRETSEAPLRVEVPTADAEPGPEADVRRFPFRSTLPGIALQPALADRRLVVRPESPIFLPPGEEVSMFVSCPLWVRIWAGEPRRLLEDEPLARPSDTWFGPDTRTGELCYGSRSRALVDPAALEPRPHRAYTAVRIRNGGAGELQLEKLNLPMPNLGLFAAPGGRLWTEELLLEREGESRNAKVSVTGRPPAEAEGAALLDTARVKPDRRLLIRAFGEIFR